MSFSMAGGGARGPEINVTPLIDVLLTLIIVFMVVVSMDKEQGETAQIPQPDQKQTAEYLTTAHRRHPDSVDERKSAADGEDQSGRSALGRFGDCGWREIYLKRAEKVVFVRGDADVDFQYVADVIDVAHHAGVQRVGLLTMDRRWRESRRPATFNSSPDS